MTSASQAHHQTRVCPRCSCILAGDQGGLYCSPCQRWLSDYSPYSDPTLAERLFQLLASRPGQRVNVYRELGIEHCGRDAWVCVKNHVKRFRRHGHVIVGRHDGTYEYKGWSRPRNHARKWLRLRAKAPA